MARNGSGSYSLVSGNPVVTGTTISSTWATNTLNDIATALTQSLAYDGQTVPIANLPMGGFKLTGLGAATTNGDALRYQQLIGVYLPLAGGTLTGSLVLSTIVGSIQWLQFAIGDQTSVITTGTKFTTRLPACTVLAVRASVQTASSSGLPTFDIDESGTSILSTKITIDANETTSTTAATPPVISDPNIADDAEITFEIDVAGTSAVGPVISMKVQWA